MKKTALLLTSSWNEIAKVSIPAARRNWPRVITWKGRAFAKSTTGYINERYVEIAVFHATERQVTVRAKYVKKKLRADVH